MARLESGACDEILTQVKTLIQLRKKHLQLRSAALQWKLCEANPRLISYIRGDLLVCLNAGAEPVSVQAGNSLFSRHYQNGQLLPGGCLIAKI